MPRLPRRPKRGWLVGPAFFGLALVFFWPLWAATPGDRMMIGPPDGDFLRQFVPFRTFVAGAWASGHVPLWNPHQYAGTPAWADIQLAVLYPWRALQVPLALAGRTLPIWAVHLEAVAHVALGAWFTHLLARRLGAATWPAAFAGVTFAFGGYVTGYPLDQLAVLDTAVWIPATLAALAAGRTAIAASGGRFDRSALAAGLLAALAGALAVTAGHPQTALYAVWAGVALLAWHAVADRTAWRGLAALAVVWLAGAALLSAAQWLPTADFAARASRTLDPSEVAAGLALWDSWQVVAPAGARAWSPDGAWGGQWVPLYVGAAALPLAAWGAWRVRAARFWLALAGGAWLVSLGGNGPLYPLLVRVLPGMAAFRHQERCAVLFSLGLAVAAGLALDRAARRGGVDARALARLAAALAAAAGLAATALTLNAAAIAGRAPASLADALAFTAVVAGLAAGLFHLRARGRLDARRLAAAAVALAALDLFSVNAGNALAPYAPVFGPDPVAAALAPRARDGRVSSEARLPGGANAASVFGLLDVTGDSPLHPAATADLVTETPEIVWWRLLGVRFVVTDRPMADAPVAPLAAGDRGTLYEVRLPAPPAWVPARVACPAAGGDGGGDSGAAPWHAADFDPQAVVAFAAGAPVGAADCAPGRAMPAGAAARLVALDPGRAVVEATLPAPGWLVWSSAYDPGWRASARAADGRVLALDVAPAYGALAAVRLPAGAWTVEWTYRPKAVIVGGLVSFLALCLGSWLWRQTRKPTRS